MIITCCVGEQWVKNGEGAIILKGGSGTSSTGSGYPIPVGRIKTSSLTQGNSRSQSEKKGKENRISQGHKRSFRWERTPGSLIKNLKTESPVLRGTSTAQCDSKIGMYTIAGSKMCPSLKA